MDNIYADVGTPTIDRYIDRKYLKKIIYQRLITNKAFGSLSLVGLHKVGKTTIVRNIFLVNENKLLEQGIISVYIVMSSFETPSCFFRALVNEIFDYLIENEIETHPLIEKKLHQFLESNTNENLHEIFGFFKIIKKKLGYRIIVVVDEFDSAKNLFQHKSSYFQILRQLASEPDYKIGFIFISRRLVESIESKIPATSAFTNVLDRIFVTPYSKEDLTDYYQLLSRYFNISDEIKNFYTISTGNFPFLMDKLSYYLVQSSNNKDMSNDDIKKIYNTHINDFYEQYEKLKNLLIEENLFDDLLHITLNLPFDIKQEKIQRLKNYGVIDQNNEIFSLSFNEYLLQQKGLSDYHRIWNKTENGLKDLSKHVYQQNYGTDWDKILKAKYQNDKSIKRSINNAFFYKSAEEINYKHTSQVYFIDTIATSGLLLLIEAEWHHFSVIFGKSKEYWLEIFNPIKITRNIIQHNRDHILINTEVKEVVVYCEKIVQIIDEYFRKS